MKNKNIENVLKVWESDNKIKIPNKKVKLAIIDQIASLFSISKSYYFGFNFENQTIEFTSEGIENILGITPNDFSLEKFFSILHPEDLEKLNKKEEAAGKFLYGKLNKEEIPFYKVVYLIRMKDSIGKFRTVLQQSRAINVSEDGKVQQVIVVHSDVSYLNISFNHKISFIGSNLPSYFSIEKEGKYEITNEHIKDDFTKRELEIIKKLAEGKTYKEIAEQLFVSPHTINTHKKNILKKAECKSTTQLIAKCISEGVI